MKRGKIITDKKEMNNLRGESFPLLKIIQRTIIRKIIAATGALARVVAAYNNPRDKNMLKIKSVV